ncbi:MULTISPECIES: hypothetical protein [unclassified Streptomyces]|uniref:hypothetical protein n=1 Tax=unclassified Streptomyces TaxID=2593676 RepID=UPI00278C5977|nr:MULTISPECIES: hypothetical protein [unclassified Streptomyces]
MTEPEPLYDGPDPFLQGVTAKWAAYLETLPDVPRTIDAILARIDGQLKAKAWLQLHTAEHGPALDKAMAAWWRVARQWKSPEELLQIVADIESGKTRAVSAEEAFPGFEARQAALAARPQAERDADMQQAIDEQTRIHDERNTQSQAYLAALHQLIADEHRYLAVQHADRRKRALGEPPYDR